jgi:Flp pilus assembly protein TadB
MAWDRLHAVVTPSPDQLEPRADYEARMQLFGVLAVVFSLMALVEVLWGEYWSALGAAVLVATLAAWSVRSHRARLLRNRRSRRRPAARH